MILIGAGGHARACIDVIEHHAGFQIAGLIGKPNEVVGKHLGYSVIGTDSDLPNLAKYFQYALIALGQIKTPTHRIQLYKQVETLGFKMPTIVAPSAHVSRHANIGAGTVVMHGAIVNAGATVGINCIINSCALVEHDANVSDHCHISTGAILNGEVVVGTGSFIGSGSVIKQGIFIGKNCLVGMGLNVRHNLDDHSTIAGHV